MDPYPARTVRGRWSRGESLDPTPPDMVSFVFHPADGQAENKGNLGGCSSPGPMPGATPTKPIGLLIGPEMSGADDFKRLLLSSRGSASATSTRASSSF